MGLSPINTTLRYLILLSLRRGRPAPASRTRHLAVSSLILGQTPDSCRSTPSSVLGLASSPARYSVHSKRHLFSRDCPRVHAACAAGLPIVLPITGGNSSFYVSFSRPHLPVVLHLVRISSSRDLSRCRRLPYRLLQEAPHPPCLMLPRRPLVRLPASQDSSPVHEIDSVPSTPFRRPTSRRSHLLSFRDPFQPVSVATTVKHSVELPTFAAWLQRLQFPSPRRHPSLFAPSQLTATRFEIPSSAHLCRVCCGGFDSYRLVAAFAFSLCAHPAHHDK